MRTRIDWWKMWRDEVGDREAPAGLRITFEAILDLLGEVDKQSPLNKSTTYISGISTTDYELQREKNKYYLMLVELQNKTVPIAEYFAQRGNRGDAVYDSLMNNLLNELRRQGVFE